MLNLITNDLRGQSEESLIILCIDEQPQLFHLILLIGLIASYQSKDDNKTEREEYIAKILSEEELAKLRPARLATIGIILAV
jgi:hypothetical protein